MACPTTACAIFRTFRCLPRTAFGVTSKPFAGTIRPKLRLARRRTVLARPARGRDLAELRWPLPPWQVSRRWSIKYTGEKWGNPNPIYYQIAQSEYGTQGGTFLGSACNSSGVGGPASSCVFHDVTQGDIDVSCRYDSTLIESHCYKPSTNGVASTDVITATNILWGGSGYTTTPTCTIAGPSNNAPYKEPNGTVLYAGGLQATCTAAVTATATTATWTVTPSRTYVSYVAGLAVVVGTQTYTLSGTSTTAIATNLCTSIGSGNAYATCAAATGVATLTAKTAGAAGNFTVDYGPQSGGPDENETLVLTITQGTKGQGPNYVSAITVTNGGRGYAPNTPITFTGGGGSGAVAVANTSQATASSSYQPTYGAAPGYDLATGLGSVNAYNLVHSCTWANNCTTTAVSSSLNPAAYGQAVSFTATVTGNSPTGTVQFYVDSALFDTETLSSGTASSISTSTLAAGTHTVTAIYSGDGSNSGSTGTLSGGQVVTTAGAGTITVGSSGSPSTYGQPVTFTATIPGQYGQVKGNKPMTVTGSVTWSSNTGCGTTPVTSGTPGTASCTTSSLPVGTDTVTANYGGDSNHSGGSGSTSQVVSQVSSATAVASSLNPSAYGQAVNFTATVTGSSPTGTVQFYVDSALFDTESLVSGSATSISTATLTAGTHTVTATYSGDTINSGSTGTLAGGQTVDSAGTTVSVGSSLNPSNFNQSVTFTATITADNGAVKGRKPNGGKPKVVAGTVTWSSNTGCGTTSVTAGYPGTATCTTSSLPAGTDTVTANYNGDDGNHNPGSGSVSQFVNSSSSSTAVSSSLNPSEWGQSVSFGATVTGNSPTGTVQFYVDSALFDTETLVSGSAASVSTSSLAAGTHTVTATYSGDSNNLGSTGLLAGGQVVGQANSSLAVTSSTESVDVCVVSDVYGDDHQRHRRCKGTDSLARTG